MLVLFVFLSVATYSMIRPTPPQVFNVSSIQTFDALPLVTEVIYYKRDPIKITKKDLDCLEKNIYYEAGVENRNGKIAVAQVTYNRLKSGKWGDTFCKVIYAPHQFSWTKQRKKEKPKGALWEESKSVAKEFVNGIRIQSLKNSIHYHATWIDEPHWADEERIVKTIGQHVFYSQIR